MDPLLATLTKQVFSDPAWVYEPKLDGQRSLLWRRGPTVRLITRNEKDRTSHYPDLTEGILRDETPPLIADGEIVAFDGDVTSFSRLQARMQNARPSTVQVAAVPVYFYLFDLIWFDGYDLSALPLLTRKSLLRDSFAFDDPIRFSEHLDQDGESAFRAACEKGCDRSSWHRWGSRNGRRTASFDTLATSAFETTSRRRRSFVSEGDAVTRPVEVTRPDKLLWPALDITKRRYVDYLDAVGDRMLPWLRERPLTVVRAPDGVGGERYYQKDTPRYAPSWIRTVAIPAPSAKREVAYTVCNDASTLT